MDAAIVPYVFESHTIRTITDEQGKARFCGKDVATALGYAEPGNAIRQHCKGGAFHTPLQTPGGIQQTRFITEADVLRLIVSSKLESAQRFESWVFDEVLPSILKTGSYVHPGVPVPLSPLQDTMAALLMLGEAVGRVPGVNPTIATAAALTMIKDQTGIDTEPMRRCLPALQTPVASLNATAIGERVGMSAKRVNRALADRGLQIRNARGEWELTEEGKAHGESMPYASNGHSGYQVLWRESVISLLVQ